MIMSQNAVADEIEIPVTQPVLLLVLSPVHGLLRRCMQGAENRTLEPVTSIRLKIEESWYASMDCKVQKSGPWVCFYGGHSTGYKLGHHPKNIEPCAHRARTVRAPCDNAPPPFWVVVPQGMILDVKPLVKSLFCPTKQSPNGFFYFEASMRELHAPCAHHAKFRYMCFHGHYFPPASKLKGTRPTIPLQGRKKH